MTPTIEPLSENLAYRSAADPLSADGQPLASTDDGLIEDWSTRFYVNEMAAFLHECGQLPAGCGGAEADPGRPSG